jgi:hypothetical protein
VSWDAPRHLVLFNRVTLTRALVEAGFASPKPCLPLVNARSWIYPVCENVRKGGDGESIERLSPTTSLRARIADMIVSLGIINRAEEVCLMAATA